MFFDQSNFRRKRFAPVGTSVSRITEVVKYFVAQFCGGM